MRCSSWIIVVINFAPVPLRGCPRAWAPPLSAAASSPTPLQAEDVRGRRAVATVGVDPAAIGYTISFRAGTDGYRGLTFTRDRHIEIYVRAGDTPWDIARVVAHELGHAVDLARGTDSMREAWRSQRAIDDHQDQVGVFC